MTGRQRYSEGKLGRSERGSTLVLVTLFMLVLFGFTAISIEVANVYREKRRAQVATDAAALAGVAKLDPSGNAAAEKPAAIIEADFIAKTNGVTDIEIASGAVSNTGTIQVGFWDGASFAANTTPYNAVRVPAQRMVPLNFGKVVGFPQMAPAVDSIAAVGVPAMQYGVPTNAVNGVAIGSNIVLQVWSSGNWGCVDLCGVSLNGKPARTAGLSNGGCFVAVGELVPTETGTDGIKEGFKAVGCNAIVVMPVTSEFPNGSKQVVILDYVVVRLVDPNCSNGGTGNGANWTYQVTLLGRGFSALRQYGLGPTRTLVE